ncbi:MAG: cytoplasmic protein [Gallionellales bacterium RIFCSPLOWO2_02_FULL_59_110]|nr:MAG: cytoplasmic protein [Gallionellales bacterium RIFCSPLOWO2_02_FULL_59_110]OGT01828.1 MAG: cytoplasmic protein [Gallionellales bacterium RIFCSPLOWO2_02_58_13]
MSLFEERLNQILPRLTSKELLNNHGLGNEIGFWVFDYPPESELEMRAFLKEVIEPALAKHHPPIRFATVNLFDLAIGLLEERNLLDKALDMQQAQGDTKALESMRRVLKEDKLAEHLVSKIDVDNQDLVILTGVGSVFPILRTHTLLSALHPLMKDTPLLMLYPGKYDGHSFRLFNKLTEDHYYRAFRLVS